MDWKGCKDFTISLLWCFWYSIIVILFTFLYTIIFLIFNIFSSRDFQFSLDAWMSEHNGTGWSWQCGCFKCQKTEKKEQTYSSWKEKCNSPTGSWLKWFKHQSNQWHFSIRRCRIQKSSSAGFHSSRPHSCKLPASIANTVKINTSSTTWIRWTSVLRLCELLHCWKSWMSLIICIPLFQILLFSPKQELEKH